MISHWDRLPVEIQTYILDLRLRQERLDVLTAARKGLCEEMRLYHYLKEKWSIGHLRCEPTIVIYVWLFIRECMVIIAIIG